MRKQMMIKTVLNYKKNKHNNMKELIEWLKKYNITDKDYDIVDGYVVMRYDIIDLSDKGITHLPEMIGNLKVNTLYLSDNNITHLPESIGDIRVKYLYLRYNKLTSLPESIGNIRVKYLYLSHNKLTSLPESICDLKVERVYLQNNNILKESIKYLDRVVGLKECLTDYSYDLKENILLSKRNSRKDKIKLLLD